MALNRRFSPFSLLILSINGMIGSAWLFAPLYAAKIAGTGAIFAWLIAGAGTCLIALTFAEIASLFPLAGGTAQIPQLSHGLLTSFILSWIGWLSALTMAPIEVMAVLQYASTYFTNLTVTLHGTPELTPLGLIWATILMFAFCIINVLSFKGLVGFNFIIFTIKICIILLTIFCLMHISFYSTNFTNMHENFSKEGFQAILVAVATGGIAFAFTGFKHGVELAGEAKRFALAIPLAIVGSVVCCLIVYLGLQIAFIGALKPDTLTAGWENLSFVGDVGPFAGLVAGLGIFWLLKLLYIDATVSPSGAGLIYVTSTARILYAMSKIGFAPKFLSHLNKENFPVAAVFTNFVIGMLLFLPLPGWQAMVSFLVSGMVISYAIGPIALLSLRIDLPQQKRTFKLPAAHFICLLAFYFCNLLCYWTGWDTLSKLLWAIGFGIVFFIFNVFQNKFHFKNLQLKSLFWLIPYLGGLGVISYLGAFGGKDIIPFGWDFLVIAIFSVVILYLAVQLRAIEKALLFDVLVENAETPG